MKRYTWSKRILALILAGILCAAGPLSVYAEDGGGQQNGEQLPGTEENQGNQGTGDQNPDNPNSGASGGSDTISGTGEDHFGDGGQNPGTGDDGGADSDLLDTISISYKTHVQTYGWQEYVSDGAMSGTTGKAKRLEGIQIKLEGVDPSVLGVRYTTHCQTYGWLPYVENDKMSGTTGEAKRLESIRIELTGEKAALYDVHYRVHAQTYGWLNWAKNGACAGTAGYAKRLEGIQILITEKGASFDPDVEGIKSAHNRAYIATAKYQETEPQEPEEPEEEAEGFGVSYKVHVQTYGWQSWKNDGELAGTTGEAKRLEAIIIKLRNSEYEGGLSYRTHVQTYGWKGFVTDNQMSGTSGEAKRLEAIEINLTGEIADYYDVYYRVHAQTFGWLGWAKNGESAGTSGYAKRLESIEIQLVEKDGEAPGSTENVYMKKPVGMTIMGSKTLTKWFGITRQDLINWLSSHESDNYYLGTPYATKAQMAAGGIDWYYPRGDRTASGMAQQSVGSSGMMNCTGFIWHALVKAGASPYKIPRVASSYKYVYPKGRKTWDALKAYEGIRYYKFSSKSAMLASGLCEKGDIIMMAQGSNPHFLIFWGDEPGQDLAWHSNDADMKNAISRIRSAAGTGGACHLIKWDDPFAAK